MRAAFKGTDDQRLSTALVETMVAVATGEIWFLATGDNARAESPDMCSPTGDAPDLPVAKF